MDVHVVAFESNEVKLAAVGLYERRDDVATDLLDLLFRTLVHGGIVCEGRGGKEGPRPNRGSDEGNHERYGGYFCVIVHLGRGCSEVAATWVADEDGTRGAVPP